MNIKIWMFLSVCLAITGCLDPTTKPPNSYAQVDLQVLDSTRRLKAIIDDSIITNEKFNTIDNHNLEQVICENIFLRLNANENSTIEQYFKEFKGLSKPQQIVYSTVLLERNVKLIGFDGYFKAYLSVGQFADNAILGYEELGAVELSNVVKRAVLIHNKAHKNSKFVYQNVDSLFKLYFRTSNISNLRTNYIRSNKDSFVYKP